MLMHKRLSVKSKRLKNKRKYIVFRLDFKDFTVDNMKQ